jgi:hypothetical protein
MRGAAFTTLHGPDVASKFKMLLAVNSPASPSVAGRVRRGFRMPGEAERAAHARFIERGYCFGISTRPDQG